MNANSKYLVGTIGHVAHGKSTVVKAISGVLTVRFKNELERNITIKLGYANAKVSQCVSTFKICTKPWLKHLLPGRYINVKVRRAQGLAAIVPTDRTKRTTQTVSDQDVAGR